MILSSGEEPNLKRFSLAKFGLLLTYRYLSAGIFERIVCVYFFVCEYVRLCAIGRKKSLLWLALSSFCSLHLTSCLHKHVLVVTKQSHSALTDFALMPNLLKNQDHKYKANRIITEFFSYKLWFGVSLGVRRKQGKPAVFLIVLCSKKSERLTHFHTSASNHLLSPPARLPPCGTCFACPRTNWPSATWSS